MSGAATLIRPLDAGETGRLIDWAAGEGWNPGLADAEKFRPADPDGFIGLFSGGEMVSAISAVAYGTNRGFIGLYICRPDRRGQGFGKAIWDAGMARLEGRIVGLDGVPAQQDNYRAMGFVTDHETLRWSGTLAGDRTEPEVIVPGPALRAALVADAEQDAFASRPAFVAAWLDPPHHVRAIIRDGRIAGHAVMRACRAGFKIGPVIADDADIAIRLVASFAAAAKGEIMSVDCPVPQAAFADRLAAAGFAPSFSTARMYRGGRPDHDRSRLYGIASLELG